MARTLLNKVAVFIFVAFWHDRNVRMLLWGPMVAVHVLCIFSLTTFIEFKRRFSFAAVRHWTVRHLLSMAVVFKRSNATQTHSLTRSGALSLSLSLSLPPSCARALARSLVSAPRGLQPSYQSPRFAIPPLQGSSARDGGGEPFPPEPLPWRPNRIQPGSACCRSVVGVRCHGCGQCSRFRQHRLQWLGCEMLVSFSVNPDLK